MRRIDRFICMSGWVMLVACIYVICIYLKSTENKELELLESRLDELEFKIDEDTSLVASELDMRELNLTIDQLRHDERVRDDKLRADFNLLLKFGFPLSLLGLLGFGWGIYKYALDEAKAAAKREVDRLYDNVEERLLSQKKFTVFSGKETGEKTMEMLRKFNIKNLQLESDINNHQDFEDRFDPDEKQKSGILFFDNGDGKNSPFNNKTIKVALDICSNKCLIFWYRGTNLESVYLQEPRISSARFASQIYSNLINMLKADAQFKKK